MSLFASHYDRAALLSQASRARARGRRKKAIELYRRVLVNEPDNEVLQKRVAQLLAQSGRVGEAVDHYRNAAEGLVSRGFEVHAIAIYRESLHYEPRDSRAWSRIAGLEAERGQLADAVETLRKGARCFRSRKERPRAVSLLEQAHELDPSSVDVALDLAQQHARDRRYGRALDVLSEVAPHVRGRELRRIRARQLYLCPTPGFLCRWLLAWLSRGGRSQRRPLALHVSG